MTNEILTFWQIYFNVVRGDWHKDLPLIRRVSVSTECTGVYGNYQTCHHHVSVFSRTNLPWLSAPDLWSGFHQWIQRMYSLFSSRGCYWLVTVSACDSPTRAVAINVYSCGLARFRFLEVLVPLCMIMLCTGSVVRYYCPYDFRIRWLIS